MLATTITMQVDQGQSRSTRPVLLCWLRPSPCRSSKVTQGEPAPSCCAGYDRHHAGRPRSLKVNPPRPAVLATHVDANFSGTPTAAVDRNCLADKRNHRRRRRFKTRISLPDDAVVGANFWLSHNKVTKLIECMNATITKQITKLGESAHHPHSSVNQRLFTCRCCVLFISETLQAGKRNVRKILL